MPLLAVAMSLGGLASAWPLRTWLRSGRYRQAAESGPLPRHTWVILALAGALALVGWGQGERTAYAIGVGVLAVPLIALAAIDLDVHRLPNWITAPLAGATTLVLAVVALVEADRAAYLRALLAGVVAGAAFTLLSLTGGLGLGDAKLAPTLGMIVGYLSWAHLAVALLLAFTLGGVVALWLILAQGAGRRARFAFGPAMIAGTLLTAALSS